MCSPKIIKWGTATIGVESNDELQGEIGAAATKNMEDRLDGAVISRYFLYTHMSKKVLC